MHLGSFFFFGQCIASLNDVYSPSLLSLFLIDQSPSSPFNLGVKHAFFRLLVFFFFLSPHKLRVNCFSPFFFFDLSSQLKRGGGEGNKPGGGGGGKNCVLDQSRYSLLPPPSLFMSSRNFVS